MPLLWARRDWPRELRQRAMARFWARMTGSTLHACGEEFIVFHDPVLVDKAAAARQALWLEKVLAEEHEREHKHADRIQLPD
jgi:hypothetical protein